MADSYFNLLYKDFDSTIFRTKCLVKAIKSNWNSNENVKLFVMGPWHLIEVLAAYRKRQQKLCTASTDVLILTKEITKLVVLTLVNKYKSRFYQMLDLVVL